MTATTTAARVKAQRFAAGYACPCGARPEAADHVTVPHKPWCAQRSRRRRLMARGARP